jgi:hypothetical protein
MTTGQPATRTLVRLPADASRTDVKLGQRSWYEGEWVERRRVRRCESGWTGDRCRRPLFHDGPHSNERAPR